jgi:hypothetical protein
MTTRISIMLFVTLAFCLLGATEFETVDSIKLGAPQEKVVSALAARYNIEHPSSEVDIWLAKPKDPNEDDVYKWHELAFDEHKRLIAVTSHSAYHTSVDAATLANAFFNQIYSHAKTPKQPTKMGGYTNARFVDSRISLHRYALGQTDLEEISIPIDEAATISLKIEKEIGKPTTVHLEYQRSQN